MNNQPVAMDLSRTKTHTWRAPQTGQSQGRPPPRNDNRKPRPWADRANATASAPQGNFTCFSCGKPGHYAKDCRSKRQQRINYVDFEPQEDEQLVDWDTPIDRIAEATNHIRAMSFDEQQQLVKELRGDEDKHFPTV
jgi:hypothetical protein